MNLQLFITFFGAIFLFSFCVGQIEFQGKCNNVTTQQNFNLTKFMGFWYELKKYKNMFQNVGSCITVNYAMDKNNTVTMTNSMNLYGKNITYQSKIKEVHPEKKDGQLNITIPDESDVKQYWVLGTDYANYSVLWSCVQMNDSNYQFAWILTRSPNVTNYTMAQINDVIKRNSLILDKFMPVKQANCTVKNRHSCVCSSANSLKVSLVAISLIILKVFLL